MSLAAMVIMFLLVVKWLEYNEISNYFHLNPVNGEHIHYSTTVKYLP